MSTPYDPIDTVRWMIARTAEELESEQTVDAAGRRRRKSKAQREREQERLRTLCEVLWNAEGRQEPLDLVVDRLAAAA